ncbi:hypothetical protein JavanS77_0015 [Streptococcus satellite phage Javan77]|nr:hypothetical protein JavanS77_0015 [Streptococcus satellite phage Javan77]
MHTFSQKNMSSMVMSGNNGNNKVLNFNFSESEKEFFPLSLL